jgi:sugar lactone lactonase YvrE
MTRHIPRRTVLKAIGTGAVAFAGGTTTAAAKSNRTVGDLDVLYEFTPFEGSPTAPPFGELPENVAIDRRGYKYVSVPSQAQIWTFSPDNELVEKPFVQFTATQEFLVGPAGLEVTPDRTLYSTFLSDFSSDSNAETNGVYAIGEEGEYDLVAPISNGIPNFPSFPNDITLFGKSLLVTDSTDGVVWEVRDGEATVWAGELWDGTSSFPTGPLAPVAPGEFGPNGIQFSKDGKTLYVANTSKGTVVRIPVHGDGTAGDPAVFATGLGGPDGLAMDTDGSLYVADNGAGRIVRVSPDGQWETIASDATVESETPIFNQPADVTFGTTGGEQKSVFIVNLALNTPLPPPTLMKLDVGVPGLPVRR